MWFFFILLKIYLQYLLWKYWIYVGIILEGFDNLISSLCKDSMGFKALNQSEVHKHAHTHTHFHNGMH